MKSKYYYYINLYYSLVKACVQSKCNVYFMNLIYNFNHSNVAKKNILFVHISVLKLSGGMRPEHLPVSGPISHVLILVATLEKAW